MKKITAYFSAFILLSLSACNKKDTSTAQAEKIGINQDKLIPFDEAGKIHNEVLSLIDGHLKKEDRNTYSSLEKQGKTIALNYVATHGQYITAENIENGYKIRPNIFQYGRMTRTTISDYAAAQLSKAESIGAIKHEEAEYINSIFKTLNEISNGQTSVSPVEAMEKLGSELQAKHYDISKGEGILANYCLSIGKASAKLWCTSGTDVSNKKKAVAAGPRVRMDYDEAGPVDFLSPDDMPIIFNPNDPDGPSFYYDGEIGLDFAQIVAADIAGAIGGALGSALDNVFHHKPIDWASAGAWAIGGAVGASTVGGIYKLIKWLL